MMRNLIYRRCLLLQRQRKFSYQMAALISPTTRAITSKPTTVPKIPSSTNRIDTWRPSLQFQRSLCLSRPDGPSNIVSIKSEEEFNSSLSKVQGRLISPVIEELSKNYPHVTTYKIDIDQEGLRSTLSKLDIRAVPTLQFFQNGKKADEMVGANIEKLKNAVAKLYKKDD